MEIGFDIISDLNLSPEDSFNWENKATSLYCIIVGNLSSDLRTLRQTLLHLSKFYQGIFYIPGVLEYKDNHHLKQRTDQIKKICHSIKNLAILYNNVVIIDGIAILGANGWYEPATENLVYEIEKQVQRTEDIVYLINTLQKLQLHLDVKKIIIATSTVPNSDLFFGQMPENIGDLLPTQSILAHDLENKIKYWVYGNYNKEVEVMKGRITYICNPYLGKKPYWAKRINV